MPPKKSKSQPSVETQGKTSLENFLFKIRDICRDKGVQMDENGNFYADLIYDDLLFLKSLWLFNNQGNLQLDVQRVVEGTTLQDIQLDSIASLYQKDSAHMVRVFNRLWTELQRSSLKSIFEREFALQSILKDEKLKVNYSALLADLLNYTGKVILDEHECTDPYEYFSKDLKKTKSKYFGQFYTPQSLAEICVEEIKPKFGEIGADVAAGTGKFMRAAAKYIEKQEPSHTAWDAYTHMRMTEIEARMYRQGIYAAFFEFQKIPDMNIQQRKGNSFELLIREQEQFDYVLANPPFGGSVLGFEEIYYETVHEEKGKRLVTKQVPKKDILYPFDFIKKDTCVLFLQLIVNKLKIGGRAAVIFNGTIMVDQHHDVMKWFLEKCNLYKIIVNPSGTFKNTNIETYCFLFTKGTPTEKIEYYELGTNKKLGEFTKEQIMQRNWNIQPSTLDKQKEEGLVVKNIKELCAISEDLLGGQRLKQAHLTAAEAVKAQMAAIIKSVNARGYEKHKLGELLQDHIVKKPVSTKDASNGEYSLYSSSCDVFKHNVYEFPAGEYLLQGSRGTISKATHYTTSPFSASNNVFVLSSKDSSKLILKYAYYFLALTCIADATATISVIPMLTKQMFQNIELCLPPLSMQEHVLTILNEMDAERKVLEEMAFKAEERAKFILEGYTTPSLPKKNSIVILDEEELVF